MWCPSRASSAPNAETCLESISETRSHRHGQKESSPNGGEPPRSTRGRRCGPRQRGSPWGRRKVSPCVHTGAPILTGRAGQASGWRLVPGAPLPQCLAGTRSPPLTASGLRSAPRSLPRVAGNTLGPTLLAMASTCGRLRGPYAPSCGHSSEPGHSLWPWTPGWGVAAGGPPSDCLPGQFREKRRRGGQCERGRPGPDPRMGPALCRAAC